MSELRFQVRRERGDFFAGIAANMAHTPSTWLWCVGGALVVACIAIAVNIDESIAGALGFGAVVFVGMLAFYVPLLALTALLAARKSARMLGAFDPVDYTFTPEGLGAVARDGEGRSAWGLWPFAFETKQHFIIRHQLNLIQIIPKRSLSPDLVAQVRAALVRYVKKTQMQKAAA